MMRRCFHTQTNRLDQIGGNPYLSLRVEAEFINLSLRHRCVMPRRENLA
jgi:hypothetical protein